MLYLPSAPDLRDLYRAGSGMTLRRLQLIIRSLPPHAFAIIEGAIEGEERRSKIARIRARQADFERRNREQLEREASA